MSGGDDEVPVERRDQKTMDSKKPGSKFNSNILSRVFHDDLSVGSVKSVRPLLAQLFFQNAAAKVMSPIGEASVSDDYPLTDLVWTF